MSMDTVDDLHAAEDTIGALGAALAAIDEFRTTHPDTGLADAPDAVRVALASGLIAARVYCRPSCYRDEPDGPWECDEDCGCPGEHDPSHDDR